MLNAIRTEGLTKRYRDVVALDQLDLEVPENTVFGFLGPNGAGKTTTVKLLTGFSRATSGRAWVAGESVAENPLGLRAKIGLLPDVPAFYDWMTGREFLEFMARCYHLDKQLSGARVRDVLELVELHKAGGRRIGGYSRGMRQRLGLAQALINHPRVLFLDEPTSALDPIGRREVLDLILKLRETTTIFMSTHILSDVERVCDLVGIVDRGRLVTVSTVEALQRRYAHSTFEIEFLEDPAPFAACLNAIPWVADVKIAVENGGTVVRVQASDLETARRELPGIVGASSLTLSRYELTLPHLEDIFMEIIAKEAHHDRVLAAAR
jgi:ABC-2 type transport system ATP-binding protein